MAKINMSRLRARWSASAKEVLRDLDSIVYRGFVGLEPSTAENKSYDYSCDSAEYLPTMVVGVGA